MFSCSTVIRASRQAIDEQKLLIYLVDCDNFEGAMK